jgi:hypothetical protein
MSKLRTNRGGKKRSKKNLSKKRLMSRRRRNTKIYVGGNFTSELADAGTHQYHISTGALGHSQLRQLKAAYPSSSFKIWDRDSYYQKYNNSTRTGVDVQYSAGDLENNTKQNEILDYIRQGKTLYRV